MADDLARGCTLEVWLAEFDGIVEQTVDPSPPFAALASWREPYELLDRVAETLGVPIAAVRSFTPADVALLRQADRLLRGKVVYADGGGELNLVATEDIREQLAAGANRRGEFGITQHRPDWPVELSFGAIDLGPVWVQVPRRLRVPETIEEVPNGYRIRVPIPPRVRIRVSKKPPAGYA